MKLIILVIRPLTCLLTREDTAEPVDRVSKAITAMTEIFENAFDS